MIVVDSSVWIDLLKGRGTRQVSALQHVRPSEIIVGDLVLLEVLQGARDETGAALIAEELGRFGRADLGGEDVAREAARNFRILRAGGLTPRSPIDLIIATFCIVNEHQLLHADRDFDAMARHLKLSFAISPDRIH